MDASKGSLKYLIIQTIEYVLTTFKAYMSNMLTILRDQAYSVATIYHVMDKIRDTVSLLSPRPRTSAYRPGAQDKISMELPQKV